MKGKKMKWWVGLCVLGLVAACSPADGIIATDNPALQSEMSSGDVADVGLVETIPPEIESGLDSWEEWVLPEAGEIGDAGWTPGPGEAGYPCSKGEDCIEGYCIQTADGMQCTISCQDECPFGWECLLHSPSLPDQLYICVPSSVDLCKPCLENTQCWTNGTDGGEACVSYGSAGNFCGGACKSTDDCPPGYECLESEDVTGENLLQCVVTKGDCECRQWYIDQAAQTACFAENEWGLCVGSRQCMAAGLTPCSAPAPAQESCNGNDDNCDGETDEDTGGGECAVINPNGTCTGIEVCDQGTIVCQGDGAQPEQCDGMDNDCDGETDEGFEDTDGDGIADCMVTDKDGDGVVDSKDNCPSQFNPSQADFDLDNFGDLCDADDDNDMVADMDDCAPKDPEVSPEVEEVCDGKDNNCNYIVDEGFADTDSDGWKDCVDEDDDNDGTGDETDCAPTNPSIHPGAVEECDGQDNDCDQVTDEQFPDLDGDGTADCVDEDSDGDGAPNPADNCPLAANPEQDDLDGDGIGDACDADDDGDAVPDSVDNCKKTSNPLQSDIDDDGQGDACDEDLDGDGAPNSADNCPQVANPQQEDLDEDGTGDLCEEDMDGDGVPDAQDCAPLDPQVHPGAEEKCDGVDNNCDMAKDEGYPDHDADGIKDCVDGDDDDDGDPDETDCAALNPLVHHDAPEVCDGQDNNCNTETDEGLGTLSCGKGACAHTAPACADGQAQLCDPFAGISEEVCDGADNDCNGLTDEGLGTTTCGLGICQHTQPVCAQGTSTQCDPLAGAGEEICDGQDNDCDGKTDEEMGTLSCGKGNCFHTVPSCLGGVEQECNPFQGALPEVCDGTDNDCDGQTDEELGTSTCGLGECLHTQENCVNGVAQLCNPFQGVGAEICDGLDNNCNSLVDDGMGTTSCGLGLCQHSVDNCVDAQPQECDPMAGAVGEICDGLDNDCDGVADNDLGSTTCGVGECEHSEPNCVAGQLNECDPLAGAVDEVCYNDIDDDCNPDTPDLCYQGSCAEVLAADPAAADGLFTIDPDQGGPGEPFVVWCDMSMDGGGWTLVAVNGDNHSLTMISDAMGSVDQIRRLNPGANVIHKLPDTVINQIKEDNGDVIGIRLIFEANASIRKFGKAGCTWESNSRDPDDDACDYGVGSYSDSPAWDGPHTNYWFSGGLPSWNAAGCPSWQRMGIYSSLYNNAPDSFYHIGSCGMNSWGTLWVK